MWLEFTLQRAPPDNLKFAPASSPRRQPLLHLGDDARAGFLWFLAGVVDDERAERNHERRGGALAVAVVARGEVFIHALIGTALGSLLQAGVEVEFEIRSR